MLDVRAVTFLTYADSSIVTCTTRQKKTIVEKNYREKTMALALEGCGFRNREDKNR